MTSDTELAFDHPEARALATEGEGPLDRISLRDHLVEVEIGAFQRERGQKQRVLFNIVAEVRPASAPLGDDVDRILSYDQITGAIAAELAGGRLNLLETLAEKVADRILSEPQAVRVFVRIEKLDIGPYKLGVEIVRSRAGAAPLAGAPALAPLVVFVDNAAIAAPDLPARLDALQARGLPVVLTVGLPAGPRPVTLHPLAQRRIDLLAIEQNAWVLAARDPRCVVMSSRTEIDWAVKRGGMMVWAPSKMVLDSEGAPDSAEAVALALWLAEMLAAERLIVHGDVAVPAGSRVALERA